MRKLHMTLHLIKYIIHFGSLNHMDTSTYESLHKHVTTGIWDMTSKRHVSMIEEMTKNLTANYHTRIMHMVNNFMSTGMKFAQQIMPTELPDSVIFARLTGIPNYEWGCS